MRCAWASPGSYNVSSAQAGSVRSPSKEQPYPMWTVKEVRPRPGARAKRTVPLGDSHALPGCPHL